MGLDGSLTKPLKPQELRNVLSLVLNGEAFCEEETHLGDAKFRVHEFGRHADHSKVKILLVEDHIINQQVALGILHKMGVVADAVSNGKEALHALEKIPYDLVLMDIQMPEMDGYETTQGIRACDSVVLNRQIPVIAMTAHTMQGDREKCLESGMNDYLPKPISPYELGEMLEKWLAGKVVIKTRYAEVKAANDKQAAQEANLMSRTLQSRVFDQEGLMARLMSDTKLVNTVLHSFQEFAQKQIELVGNHLEAGDMESIKKLAHGIKGAAANIGATSLSALGSRIELAAKSGDIQLARAEAVKLPNEYERFLTEANRFASGLNS